MIFQRLLNEKIYFHKIHIFIEGKIDSSVSFLREQVSFVCLVYSETDTLQTER